LLLELLQELLQELLLKLLLLGSASTQYLQKEEQGMPQTSPS
jgi:hypothetical protein